MAGCREHPQRQLPHLEWTVRLPVFRHGRFRSRLADSTDRTTSPSSGNEISYNDTCDFSGLLNNPAIGWKNYNPVPERYRNAKCGTVVGDGDQGGFKLWQTNGVTIEDNYIHNNWGPGGWADTNNANTTWTGNTITTTRAKRSSRRSPTTSRSRTTASRDNDWIDGLNNSGFPQPAIFISESGSDTTFGGVPACREARAQARNHIPSSLSSAITCSSITAEAFFCGRTPTVIVRTGRTECARWSTAGSSGPFTISGCKAIYRSASVNTTTYTGNMTGSPSADWWNGCLWRTENVSITRNMIDFNPANIMDCNRSAWPACGAVGIFSEYGSPLGKEPGWVVPTQLTFFQDNTWSDNVYNGPSTFFAWNQGNGDNPVSWGRLDRKRRARR